MTCSSVIGPGLGTRSGFTKLSGMVGTTGRRGKKVSASASAFCLFVSASNIVPSHHLTSVTVLVDPYPFPPTHDPQACLEETGMISHQITPWLVHFSFHNLVTTSFLGQNPRSRSTDLDLLCFPFQQTITSNNTSLYSIVLFYLSTYSKYRYLPSSLPYCSCYNRGPPYLIFSFLPRQLYYA